MNSLSFSEKDSQAESPRQEPHDPSGTPAGHPPPQPQWPHFTASHTTSQDYIYHGDPD